MVAKQALGGGKKSSVQDAPKTADEAKSKWASMFGQGSVAL